MVTAGDATGALEETRLAPGMRQTRYAVVLNGGVSLAIWMGGVTAELNRMRLASESLYESVGGLAVSPAWTAILEACERSVIVDVLAGTSAGGLNGTLLATAVARGGDMPNMGEQWAKVASLEVGALTRENPNGATSLLDGDYFREKLRDILGMITPQKGLTPRECTLLVTATALDADPITTKLDAGAEMFTRNGRRVYKFQRGAGPDLDHFAIDPEAANTLTLAARASASFPVAFSPVQETCPMAALRVDKHPDQMDRWLVDGGVLDNAPFEPLLDVLRERPISERFERVLLYITPGVSRDDRVTPPPAPLKLMSSLKSVISAMREPDARLDAQALHDLFEQMSFTKVQSYKAIAHYLKVPGSRRTEALLHAAYDLFPIYRRNRAEATERWLAGESTGDPDGVPLTPPAKAILDPDRIAGIPPGVFPACDRSSWMWGWSAADRILRWWGRAVSTVADDNDATQAAMTAIGNAQRLVFAREPVLDAAVAGTEENPMRVGEQLVALAAVYEDLAPELLHGVLAAADAIAVAVPGVDADMLIRLSLAIEVISGIFSWSASGYDTPVLRFYNITPAADKPPGLDLGPDGEQSDWSTKKLYGERLGHFGAFISPEGRRHDWLWGRLDGASELSKQMLAAAGKTEEVARPLREALVTEILKAEGVSDTDIVAGATKVYNAKNWAMIRRMAADDRGRSFRRLGLTVLALSTQWGVVGAVLRAMLAPRWSIAEERSTVPIWLLPLLQSIRMPIAGIRRILRSKLLWRLLTRGAL